MANTLANLTRMSSATVGTGTLTLDTAVTGCLTFDQGGITNGQTVTYAIEDYDGSGNVSQREIGAGVYTTAGKTLTRSVYKSTNSDAAISCSGSQQVFITVSKEDLATYLTSALAASTYQPLDSDLTTLAANITAFGHSLVNDADASAARTTLGLGTMATETAANYLTTAAAAAGYQPLDGELTAIAGLTSAADRLPYFTGSGTASLATFTAAGRALIDDADASAQRTTLGLGTAATQNTGTSGANLPFLNVANTWSVPQTFQGQTHTFEYIDDGAATGPVFNFRRVSTAPAAGNSIAGFNWVGKDSLGNDTGYGLIEGIIVDPTNGSEDGRLRFWAYQAGVQNVVMKVGLGIAVGVPTGAERGDGTLNAVTLYENGTSLASKYGALASANVFTAQQNINYASAQMRVVASSGDAISMAAAAAGSNAYNLFSTGTSYSSTSARWAFGRDNTAESGSDAGSKLFCYYYTDAGAFKGTLFTASRADGSVTWGGVQTVSVDSAATNTVTTVATVRSTSSGTPAAGIGVAIDFAAETAAGNNEIGARISAVTTDVTAASEDFDLVFSAMAAGAAVAEVGRVTSKGTYKHKSFTVAGLPAGTAGETCFTSNGRKNGEGAGLGTGVLVFHDGTNWCACDTGAAVAA